ncbi:MAG: DUF2892 domain-containing protein [Nitrospinales bacterium]
MNTKRRIHDGIAGAVIALGTGLGYWIDPMWLLVPGVLGVILIQSAFTGFCPVYFILDKVCATESEPGNLQSSQSS